MEEGKLKEHHPRGNSSEYFNFKKCKRENVSVANMK
jgi:hypothetical protein